MKIELTAENAAALAKYAALAGHTLAEFELVSRRRRPRLEGEQPGAPMETGFPGHFQTPTKMTLCIKGIP
jgi:hypothetical protein